MDDTTPMDEDHKKVAEMSEKIRAGEYRVEPVAVADAILRQLRALAIARQEHVAGRDARAAVNGFRSSAHSPPAGLASR
jgi:hypothetical protein